MSQFHSKVAAHAERQNRAMTEAEVAEVKAEYRQWMERQLEQSQSELTAAKAENEALRGRVSELESREDAMCDLAYANGAKQGFSLGQLSDNAGLEQIVAPRYLNGIAELKSLRTQAEAAEKGGDDG